MNFQGYRIEFQESVSVLSKVLRIIIITMLLLIQSLMFSGFYSSLGSLSTSHNPHMDFSGAAEGFLPNKAVIVILKVLTFIRFCLVIKERVIYLKI